jgi:hypothetical protein
MRLGKDKQAEVLAVFLFFTLTAAGQPVKNYKYQLNGGLQENIVVTDDHTITINYSVSELNFENLVNDNGTFYRFSIPGHIPASDIGKPELPVLSRLITVPSGYSCKVRITGVRSAKIKPSNKKIEGILFPAQEGETKEPQKKKPLFQIDKATYAAREFLKSDTVRIETLGTVRGKNLANIYISPVRYNPHSNILEVITSMKIEITFSGSGINETKALFPESPLFSKTLEKGLLNYNPEDLITGYTDKPVRMVILTDTSFKKQLKPFIKWKTQKGFRLEILYKGAAYAGDDYTALKNAITSIYNSSSADNPPPEYLLIIGDVNKVPFYGTGNVTDLYYGEFDGNGDFIPDMFIGRLPVADTIELKAVVRKIIQYEKFEFADTNKFYSNALITAGIDAGHASTMNGQVKYSIDNYLTQANKIKEYHYYAENINGTTKTSIINHTNKGLSFINYTGHGQATGWLLHSTSTDTANIYVSDLTRFRNKNMYPFIIGNACQTAKFNTGSLANKMVVSGEKGAIGYIGCSNDSYWDEDFYWAVGIGTPSSNPTYETTGLGAIDRLFHTHGEKPSDWYITMGQVNYAGNLSVSSSTSSRKKYYWETYNLIGDPSIIPIIGTPDSFNIALPDTLPNNLKSYSFIADPYSYIAVSHFDTLWDASYTSPSGSVTLEMPGLSEDSCLIVITGQNKVPLIKTIYFSACKKEFINLTKTGINDVSGNNNGLADFGETFFLNLTISNLGLADAGNLYAKISSVSDWVTIVNDSVKIGTLASGSAKVSDHDLLLSISKNIPDKGIITLDLILKDDAAVKHYKIDITVHAPKLDIISYIMDDFETGNGNYVADPGEVFKLIFRVRNSGSSSTSGTLNISSPNSEISVLEPSKSSGPLEYEKITDIPVVVKLSENVPSGTTINILSMLDCNPYFVNKDFSFRVGRVRESFEAASFRLFPWINISSKPWKITTSESYDGTLAARSGEISHNSTSTLAIKALYAASDSIKFYYKVSSEKNYDCLIFKINDTEVFRKSGDIQWEKIAIPVQEGLNKLEWIYNKDQSISSGLDCAMIDKIDFAGTGSVIYIQKDLVTARIVSPFNKENLEFEPVTINVLNIGPDTIKGFNLAYSVNDGVHFRQHFNKSIIPFGDSVTVTFDSKADLSHYGEYSLTAYSYENDDDYLLNDTLKVSIKNDELDGPLLVFPNPFRDELNLLINSKFNAIAHISLTSSTGKKIIDFKQEIIAGINNAKINDPRLVPGVFYLKVEFPGVSQTVPVVKIK